MRFGFSATGLIVFILPMLINIAYVIFPPRGEVKEKPKFPLPEAIENITRILYMAVMCVLIFYDKPDFRSPWFFAAAVFIALYYAVWAKYFIKGRNITYLSKKFLFVPLSLAVFPVLYFIFAAVWLKNIPAAAIMLIFGAAHIRVTYLTTKADISGS